MTTKRKCKTSIVQATDGEERRVGWHEAMHARIDDADRERLLQVIAALREGHEYYRSNFEKARRRADRLEKLLLYSVNHDTYADELPF